MKTNTCETQNAKAYLQGAFTARQEQEYLQHLDACASCRERLEAIAGSRDLWTEVREFLAPEAPLEALAEAEDTRELSLPVRQVIQSLQPTDDPRSMGRVDNFEITGVVGSGAMGVVLKANDTSLDRVVALKVMNPALAASGTARSRFAREAKAAAAVHHPNVLAIHGVRTSVDLPYLVMPYLKGDSLQQRVDRQGSFSLTEILRIGSQIAAGLAAAHQQGVVHRDIKPSNIMLDDGVEAAIITDFGLARIVDDATMTRTGVISGTPEFMSPEQARGDAIDGKSDIFSLGSLLYMLCTGYPPFRAHTSFGVLGKIANDTPKPIRQLNAEIPAWLCQIVEELHQKDPVSRPSASETQATLEACLAHVYQPDQVALPVQYRNSTTSPVTHSPIRSVILSALGPVSIGVLMMLTSITLLAFLVYYDGEGDPPSKSPDEMPVKIAEVPEQSPKVFKTLNLSFPNPKQRGSLEVDIERGFIEVTTHDSPDVVIEILVPPSSRVASTSAGLRQQFSPTYDLDIEEDSNQIKLDTYNQYYVLNLRIKVPKRTDLRLDSYRDGYITVAGVNGTILTRSEHSDITLENISGSAEARSRNGSLEISFRKLSEDAVLDFESYNGRIDLSLPQNAKLTTAISSGRGSFGSEFEITPVSIDALNDSQFQGLSESEYSFGTINEGGIPLRIECAKSIIAIRKKGPQ